MKVLVTYGSKRQGTEGLADLLAASLRGHGIDTDLVSAPNVASVAGYDAVVVGGALYAMRWHRAARRFVKRFTPELRERKVLFFSSGPLDDSATTEEIPPTSQVRRLMHRVGAREHRTFGGRLLPDAQGFPASAMAKDHAGDWRDVAAIRQWGDHIAAVLTRAAMSS